MASDTMEGQGALVEESHEELARHPQMPRGFPWRELGIAGDDEDRPPRLELTGYRREQTEHFPRQDDGLAPSVDQAGAAGAVGSQRGESSEGGLGTSVARGRQLGRGHVVHYLL